MYCTFAYELQLKCITPIKLKACDKLHETTQLQAICWMGFWTPDHSLYLPDQCHWRCIIRSSFAWKHDFGVFLNKLVC